MAASSKTTKTTVQAPASRETTAEKVVNLRNVGLMSWAQIGAELGFAPRTARRLYQESQGEHSHHGLLPSKGGRLPKGFVTTDAKALTAPGSAPWVARTEAPEGIAGTKGSAVVAVPAPAKVRPARKPKVAK
jgi:hypothetical protein